MSKKRLIKRLSWYYPTELFNAFLFTGIAIRQMMKYPFSDIVFLIYGLFVMVVILLQGQYYFKKKLDRLKGLAINQPAVLQFFRTSKKVNVILILLIPFIFTLQFYLNGWVLKENNLMGWAICANLFAVLEHINYFHWQLMYDNKYDKKYLKINKRLKISSLRKDLRENQI